MKKVCKILGLGIALVITLQSIQFTISSFFYTNFNQVLVANCCKNKTTDPSCKAKCFLGESEKQQKDTNASTIKKIECLVHNFAVLKLSKVQNTLISETKKTNYKYQNQYLFLFLKEKFDPPING